MNPRHALPFLVLLAFLFQPFVSSVATGDDRYSSYWKCSDGNTYGLVASGKKRELYLASGQSPIFFSGVNNGKSYSGTIFVNGQQIPVSGPVSNNDTRIHLITTDGVTWVLDFLRKG